MILRSCWKTALSSRRKYDNRFQEPACRECILAAGRVVLGQRGSRRRIPRPVFTLPPSLCSPVGALGLAEYGGGGTSLRVGGHWVPPSLGRDANRLGRAGGGRFPFWVCD